MTDGINEANVWLRSNMGKWVELLEAYETVPDDVPHLVKEWLGDIDAAGEDRQRVEQRAFLSGVMLLSAIARSGGDAAIREVRTKLGI